VTGIGRRTRKDLLDDSARVRRCRRVRAIDVASRAPRRDQLRATA
jgi:hypothetical protein